MSGPLRGGGIFLTHTVYLDVRHVCDCLWVTNAVCEDNDGDGDRLRSVLAATSLRHRTRRPPTFHLELRAHPAGMDRLPLVGGQQLLLEPDRLLLDQRHPASRLHLRPRNVVSMCPPTCYDARRSLPPTRRLPDNTSRQ